MFSTLNKSFQCKTTKNKLKKIAKIYSKATYGQKELRLSMRA